MQRSTILTLRCSNVAWSYLSPRLRSTRAVSRAPLRILSWLKPGRQVELAYAAGADSTTLHSFKWATVSQSDNHARVQVTILSVPKNFSTCTCTTRCQLIVIMRCRSRHLLKQSPFVRYHSVTVPSICKWVYTPLDIDCSLDYSQRGRKDGNKYFFVLTPVHKLFQILPRGKTGQKIVVSVKVIDHAFSPPESMSDLIIPVYSIRSY